MVFISNTLIQNTLIQNTLIQNKNKNNLISPIILNNRLKNTIVMNNFNLLAGIDIGIPLTIFYNIYTNLHYGYNIVNFKVIFIQFLLGYFAYGKDRYSDAQEYKENPYPTNKIKLYNSIIENKDIYISTLALSFFIINYILLTDYGENYQLYYNLPFIPIFYIAGEYKKYKQNLQEYKSIYIGFMWTLSCVILPCVLYEHNYNIFLYPSDYLPCLLTIFATSNFADNKDILEDSINNINTIPVKYGKEISNIISFIALAISSILLIENANFYNREIINSFVEFQNFALMGLLYNNTYL